MALFVSDMALATGSSRLVFAGKIGVSRSMHRPRALYRSQSCDRPRVVSPSRLPRSIRESLETEKSRADYRNCCNVNNIHGASSGDGINFDFEKGPECTTGRKSGSDMAHSSLPPHIGSSSAMTRRSIVIKRSSSKCLRKAKIARFVIGPAFCAGRPFDGPSTDQVLDRIVIALREEPIPDFNDPLTDDAFAGTASPADGFAASLRTPIPVIARSAEG